METSEWRVRKGEFCKFSHICSSVAPLPDCTVAANSTGSSEFHLDQSQHATVDQSQDAAVTAITSVRHSNPCSILSHGSASYHSVVHLLAR